MKIKTYLSYALSLPILIAIGVVAIAIELLNDPFGIFSTWFLLGALLITLCAPPVISFLFTKRAIKESRLGLVTSLLWLTYLMVISTAVLWISFGEFATEYLIIAFFLFVVPSLVSGIFAAVFYSKRIDLQGRIGKKTNLTRSVIESAVLCLGVAVFVMAFDAIYSTFHFEFHVLTNGVHNMIICIQALSALAYGYGRYKKAASFPTSDGICMLVFSVLSMLLLVGVTLVSARFFTVLDTCFYGRIVEANNYAVLMAMSVIPAAALCVGALAAKLFSVKKSKAE